MTTTITARITGIDQRGRRTFGTRTFPRVKRAELNFIPASVDGPAQARIWYEVWGPKLRRYGTHVALIVQDDALDLQGIQVVEVVR